MSRTRSRDELILTPGETTVEAINRNLLYNGLFDGRTIPKNSTIYFHYGTGSPGGDHSHGVEGVKETIVDETDSPGLYNPVLHTKEVWDCPVQVVKATGVDFYNHPDVDINCTSTIGAGGAVEIGMRTGGNYITTSAETLLAEAVTQMDPSRIDPGELNVPQFVGELRELRDLTDLAALKVFRLLPRVSTKYYSRTHRAKWDSQRNPLSFVRSITSRLTRQELSEFKRKPIGTLAKELIQLDLANKFAIQPLIGDLKKIANLVEGLSNLKSKLQNADPFRVYGMSYRDDTDSFSASGAPYDYYLWDTDFQYRREVRSWAMVKYNNPLSFLHDDFLSEVHRSAVAIGEYLGFRKLPAVAWELLPMSFIVDWFLDIGSYLRQFDVGTPLEFPFTVVAQGYSVKDTAISHTAVRHHAGAYRSIFQAESPYPLVKGSLTRTIYERRREALPWGAHQLVPPKIRLPDLNKSVTLLELSYLFSGI